MSPSFFERCESDYPRAISLVRRYIPLGWPEPKEVMKETKERDNFSIQMSSKDLEDDVIELFKKVETELMEGEQEGQEEQEEQDANEEEEEANGERACPDSIPDVNANMDDQSNEQTDSNVSESFDSMLRVFLVCLLISLLYFTLPLFSFIFLLLAVFLFLLYGKKVEKLFS